jgi:hypothetical protein
MHGFFEIGTQFNGFSVLDTAGRDFAFVPTGGVPAGDGSLSDLTWRVAQIALIPGRDEQLSEMS